MAVCGKCGNYQRYADCGCIEFSINDHNGEEHKIYAFSADSAALIFAQKYNEDGDYSLMNDSEVIEVDGVRFEISAEQDIRYSANEI